jgi:ssDNA-binding Zn-finger/Zn-ribbon topoisomerase 1
MAKKRKKEEYEPDVLSRVLDRMRHEQIFNRYPLFVLGSGISSGMVPFLSELSSWFALELRGMDLPQEDLWLIEDAEAISRNTAKRRDAAEFFSVLQGPDAHLSKLWNRFSQGFLIKGLELPHKHFPGLCSKAVEPTEAHTTLASLVRQGLAFVISLNFDGLTHKALISDGHQGQVLHSASDIGMYFTADSQTHVPAIIKVRGDVFYAECQNASCNISKHPYPIDRLRSFTDTNRLEEEEQLVCPNCRSRYLRLQFQFPGYREKEEAAHPMLWATRRFIASRLSAVVVVGLSGRWDRYMLQFLFDLAIERNLLLIDVKPASTPDLINEFRTIYYPSVEDLSGNHADHALYARLTMTANDFFGRII